MKKLFENLSTSDFKVSLLLLIPFIIFYNTGFRTIAGGDSLAHLYVASSLWNTGDFELSEFLTETERETNQLPYFLKDVNGQIRTIFAFFPGVLLAPLGVFSFLSEESGVSYWASAGRILNLLLIYFSGVIFWILLKERIGKRLTLLSLIAFWLATPVWPLSMSYLQHLPSIFFQLLSLLLLLGRTDFNIQSRKPIKIYASGLAQGLAVLCRYQVALSALPFFLLILYLLRSSPRRIVLFAVGALVPAIILLSYNYKIHGSPFDTGYIVYPWATFDAPFFSTLYGLLLNPSKGLLIHSPWMIFILPGIVKCLRDLKIRQGNQLLLTYSLVTSVPLLVLYSFYTGWFGGWSWGYRFLLDILPQMIFLSIFGCVFLNEKRILWSWLFSGLLIVSATIQSIGFLSWDNQWHRIHDLGTKPYQNWLWQTRHSQVLWHLKRGTIYIGSGSYQLRKSPFELRGFHGVEQWGDESVAWTNPRGASFYAVADQVPAELKVLPSQAADHDSPLDITILVNGEIRKTITVEDQSWVTIPLQDIPFQHGYLITIQTSETWQEPDGLKRKLGVAVILP